MRVCNIHAKLLRWTHDDDDADNLSASPPALSAAAAVVVAMALLASLSLSSSSSTTTSTKCSSSSSSLSLNTQPHHHESDLQQSSLHSPAAISNVPHESTLQSIFSVKIQQTPRINFTACIISYKQDIFSLKNTASWQQAGQRMHWTRHEHMHVHTETDGQWTSCASRTYVLPTALLLLLLRTFT